jgi:hypothetical protein
MDEVLVQDRVPHTRCYWIYDVRIRFEVLKDDGEWEDPKLFFTRPMVFRTEPDEDALMLGAWHYWFNVRDNRYPLSKIRGWWLTWFQHETFDIGQTDREARLSFTEYTWWAERQGTVPGSWDRKKVNLMGGEDPWRWRPAGVDNGYHEGGENADRIPCRCSACSKQGVLRIAH